MIMSKNVRILEVKVGDEGDRREQEVGAVIALCKAMGADVVETCRAVLESIKNRASKKKAPTRQATGRKLGSVRTGRVLLKVPEDDNFFDKEARNFGVVGTPTKFVDRNGKALSVGDLVTVDMLTGTVREGRKWAAAPGLHFVVCEDSDDEFSKGAYIMGLLSGCNEKTGKIDGHCRVKLAKTWREVEFGDVHDHLTPVWEGEKHV